MLKKNTKMRKFFFIISVMFVCVSLPVNAQGSDTIQFSYSVKQTNDWVWYSPDVPQIEVMVRNSSKQKRSADVLLTVTTDDRRPVYSFSQSVSVEGRDSLQVNFSFTLPQCGFYRCTVVEKAKDTEKEIKRFNIGFEPEAIVSLPDYQKDIRTFWDNAKKELASVAPEYSLTEIKDSSTSLRRVYRVDMKSLGGESISGYYLEPVKKGKYPTVITYMGYGSKPWIPGANDRPEYAEFVLSVRGQGLNEKDNKYGDWITFGLENQNNYYYRGAFMDLVRAIDFVCSREKVDQRNIFAEGGSQGGAFTLAAAALDSRISCIAPYIPFLSDYPDYFKITHWPMQPVVKKQQELGMSDAQMYRVLSYFDIKNLAMWITCPVIMASGLQDDVCPPHTNFSSYNRIRTEKQYRIYPTYGHDVPSVWWTERNAFFKKHIK